MMKTALDTNVLSSLWDEEPTSHRLTHLLDQSRREGSLVISGAVYAEALAHPRTSEAFIRQFLADTHIDVDFLLNESTWAEAGRRYRNYAERRRRSSKDEPRGILADFIIGAHAAFVADRLITLDQGRYQRDFPELTLLS